MSGPKSGFVTTDPLMALLLAAGMQAANAVADGYAQAATLREQHREAADALQNSQRAADARGQAARGKQAAAAEAAFDAVARLAANMQIAAAVQDARPPAPDAQDSAAVAAYVRALQELTEQLRSILLTEAARRAEEFADLPEFAPQLAANLTLPQKIAQRLLARIAHLGPAPDQIQKIALELEQTPPGERADLLATELRARIQAHIEAQQRSQVQQATALIVAQSLKDLGYQVEDIADTLFVEGGVVHFRRQGWGNYMVRMRVDAKAGAVNFNVLRAVAQGENERSVLDHLAEDRWCTEFPALLQALAARGVHIEVTRHLQAGELPVQLVDAGKLPRFADEEDGRQTAQTQAMKLS
ncbi:MAG: hypothetical protein P4L91_16100 [Burkholderiaceae bacterium]|nr:hypothetical protein [Burkholderiaceae bacterium]